MLAQEDLKLGAPGFLKSHWSAGVLLTHIAMSHELQRGTKRSAVLELPMAQQMRVATAVETPSYQQQQQQWQCMQMQPL